MHVRHFRELSQTFALCLNVLFIPEVPGAHWTGLDVTRTVSVLRSLALGLVWVLAGPELGHDPTPAGPGAACVGHLPGFPWSLNINDSISEFCSNSMPEKLIEYLVFCPLSNFNLAISVFLHTAATLKNIRISY